MLLTPRRGWAYGERRFDSQQGFFPLKLLRPQVLIARARGAALSCKSHREVPAVWTGLQGTLIKPSRSREVLPSQEDERSKGGLNMDHDVWMLERRS